MGFLDKGTVFPYLVPYLMAFLMGKMWHEGTDAVTDSVSKTETTGKKLAGTFPYISPYPPFFNMGPYGDRYGKFSVPGIFP